MHRGCRAHKWRENGQLELIEGAAPEAALVEAVETIDSGLARRMKKQERDFEEEQKRNAANASRTDHSRIARRK